MSTEQIGPSGASSVGGSVDSVLPSPAAFGFFRAAFALADAADAATDAASKSSADAQTSADAAAASAAAAASVSAAHARVVSSIAEAAQGYANGAADHASYAIAAAAGAMNAAISAAECENAANEAAVVNVDTFTNLVRMAADAVCNAARATETACCNAGRAAAFARDALRAAALASTVQSEHRNDPAGHRGTTPDGDSSSSGRSSSSVPHEIIGHNEVNGNADASNPGPDDPQSHETAGDSYEDELRMAGSWAQDIDVDSHPVSIE